VEVDRAFFRPAEVEILHSNPAMAKSKLGWSPEVDFAGLVK